MKDWDNCHLGRHLEVHWWYNDTHGWNDTYRALGQICGNQSCLSQCFAFVTVWTWVSQDLRQIVKDSQYEVYTLHPRTIDWRLYQWWVFCVENSQGRTILRQHLEGVECSTAYWRLYLKWYQYWCSVHSHSCEFISPHRVKWKTPLHTISCYGHQYKRSLGMVPKPLLSLFSIQGCLKASHCGVQFLHQCGVIHRGEKLPDLDFQSLSH